MPALIRFFLFLLICANYSALAQTSTPTVSLKKVIHTEQIEQVFTIATQGIFVANTESILQYSYDGSFISKHVLEHSNNDICIDATNAFHILIYDKDANRATFADRWLRKISELELDAAYKLACMAKTGDLWLYNSFNHSIIKYNPNLQQTLAEISLSNHFVRKEKVIDIKEFEHFIALRTNKNLYFLSAFGELVSKIEITEHTLSHLGQESLWLLKGRFLQKLNLYNKESTTYKVELSKPNEIKQFIVAESEKKLILSSGNSLYLYELPSLVGH